MRRGTTPTCTFTTNVDLTGCTVFVTFQQNGQTVIEKTGTDLTITATDTGSTVALTLTQLETLALEPGRVLVQIRYVDSFGTADASSIITATAEAILKDGVITYV